MSAQSATKSILDDAKRGLSINSMFFHCIDVNAWCRVKVLHCEVDDSLNNEALGFQRVKTRMSVMKANKYKINVGVLTFKM